MSIKYPVSLRKKTHLTFEVNSAEFQFQILVELLDIFYKFLEGILDFHKRSAKKKKLCPI